ncbi:hypothetical protein PR048_018687 [Dryococelus australis]|uniref:Transposase n=1 Tax=Dryococelus australis TaxID=614101 RepID=A0ABQ9HD61_9NEOP|nr:hypothetical protein PR048_018687 [Dryococelus australis]
MAASSHSSDRCWKKRWTANKMAASSSPWSPPTDDYKTRWSTPADGKQDRRRKHPPSKTNFKLTLTLAILADKMAKTPRWPPGSGCRLHLRQLALFYTTAGGPVRGTTDERTTSHGPGSTPAETAAKRIRYVTGVVEYENEIAVGVRIHKASDISQRAYCPSLVARAGDVAILLRWQPAKIDMARHYKRKTQRQSWNEDNMKKSLETVAAGMGKRTVAGQFGVPVMTLKRRAFDNNINATSYLKILGCKRPVFTPQQEEELVSYMLAMENRKHGCCFDYQLAERNGIVHNFSHQNKAAWKDQLRGFRLRHPHLSLRLPESTSVARPMGFDKPVVTKLFTLLKEEYKNYNYRPHWIFNVDETSLSNARFTNYTKNLNVIISHPTHRINYNLLMFELSKPSVTTMTND